MLSNRFNESGLNNLQELYLNDNQFTGTIPPSLESLDAIRVISLNNNLFNGSVPHGICDLATHDLNVLVADCSGDPGNECSCCSTCCDRAAQTCQPAFGGGDDSIRQLQDKSIFSGEPTFLSNARDQSPHAPRLATPKCTAKYRWDSETGLLEPYE